MPRRLRRLHWVTSVTGKQPSTVYRDIANGEFPPSVPIGDRAVAWIEDEVLEWVEKRIAEARDNTLIKLSYAAEVLGVPLEDLEPYVDSGDLHTVTIGKNIMVRRTVIDKFQKQHVETNQGKTA